MFLLFGLTLFTSSLLLFLVEPMIARMALPLLGSTPSVWNTSMLFFQAVLLAGYAYAHLATRWLGPRRQALLHVGLLLLVLPMLPISIPAGWIPPVGGNPAWWLLAVLAVAVGLPFFLLSSTAPLLQRWLASTTHRAARDPYVLYRASNLGSAIALIAYPFVMEPTLRLAQQARVWELGFAGLVVLAAASVATLLRTTSVAKPSRVVDMIDDGGMTRPVISGGSSDAVVPWEDSAASRASVGQTVGARKLRWLGLAFVPSSLMLAVTTYATSDIAPIPLLWIIPLTLYLLSFVLVFSPRAGRLHRWMTRAFPFAVLSVAVPIAAKVADPLLILVPLHLVAFFVVAMVCHGELARDRPDPRHLTEFYLWIALGGVLGGTFNAIVAPRIFNSFLEYPVVLVLACLLLPGLARAREDAGTKDGLPPVHAGRHQRRLDVLVPVGLAAGTAAFVGAALHLAQLTNPMALAIVLGLPGALCFLFVARPVRFGLSVAAILLVAGVLIGQPGRVLFADRTFFGVHRAVAKGQFHLLMHGNTLHGAQSLDLVSRDEPLTYYTRTGPLGQIFQAFDRGRPGSRVGVVGLGAGTMACYAQPGERWTFYEIDPAIERIAEDPHLFTYLRDCVTGRYDVVLGDARLSLRRVNRGRYGLLAVDAFNSDAIPVHLITRQALRVYLERLTPRGILAFHITNRYLDLGPVMANLARDASLVAFVRNDRLVPQEQLAAGKLPSVWVVMARSSVELGPILHDARWKRLQPNLNDPVWTDDFSNILATFKWH